MTVHYVHTFRFVFDSVMKQDLCHAPFLNAQASRDNVDQQCADVETKSVAHRPNLLTLSKLPGDT